MVEDKPPFAPLFVGVGAVLSGWRWGVNHEDHVGLISGGVARRDGVWADLGSGEGAFTLALADLLGPDGKIYSVDKDGKALRGQASTMRFSFPDVPVEYITGDFTQPLDLPPLDGIVMANSLHFVRHKYGVIETAIRWLKPGGRFILVEYNSDKGNAWVPYPLSYPSWEEMAQECGFTSTKLLATIPSRFLGEIYAALSIAD